MSYETMTKKWKLEERIAELEAERERYRQMAEHCFTPATTDRDTCNRCSLNFRDPVHIRSTTGAK